MGKNRKSTKKAQRKNRNSKKQNAPNRMSVPAADLPEANDAVTLKAAQNALVRYDDRDTEEATCQNSTDDPMETARQALNAAIDQDEAEPGKHIDALLSAYQSYVVTYAEEGFLGKALRAHGEALDLLRELYQKNPEFYGPKLVEALLLARALWFDPANDSYATDFLVEAEMVSLALVESARCDLLPQRKAYLTDVVEGYQIMDKPMAMAAFQKRALATLKRATESLPEYQYLVCGWLLAMADSYELFLEDALEFEDALDPFGMDEEEEAERHAALKELEAADPLKEAYAMKLDPAVVGEGHCDALLGQAAVRLGAKLLKADHKTGAALIEEGMARLNRIPEEEPSRLPALLVGLRLSAYSQAQQKQPGAAVSAFERLITLLLDKAEYESGPAREQIEQALHEEFDLFLIYLKAANKDPEDNEVYQRAMDQVGPHLTEFPGYDDLGLDEEDFDEDDFW
ncbi:hypothetical protein [Acanthopleuribacter pedis]|uniref:Uncharacterized protein n=1 Tax=Acanthopleuribacter pedis TaxID=442870 RepID=A0A8J7U5T1_9BACT|nr:hypothetical protein [Acanthopleuribacter pedis]MBO1320788.1 hypothetical protein [Acanthopleuribacter pedis]